MTNKYYYLITALPYLGFDRPLPLTREAFLAECAKWLSQGDLRTVTAVDREAYDAKEGDPAVIREWKEFDRYLRGGLAGVREARRSDSRESIPFFFKEIFEERTPLLMERAIEKKRWAFLDEKEAGYHFDINFLILYYLKLQVLERLGSFDAAAGRERFDKLCEVMYG
jgi:hypothetical protein